MSTQVTIKANGQTDVGQVRSINQDSFLLNQKDKLFVVADGMGGHAGGEIASQLCIQEISAYISQQTKFMQSMTGHPDNRVCGVLVDAINHASTKIYERALEDPSLRGMGTTATVCQILDQHAYVAHVGDSRLYLLRCGYIYQITNDHSLVSEQVRAGILSEEEAELHHLRNVITRSVGFQEEEDVDTAIVELENDDIIIISSDGLHGPVNDREISNMANSANISSVDSLIQAANDRGGEDNITVIIAHVKVSP